MTEHQASAAPAPPAPPPLVDHGSRVDLRAEPVSSTALARAFVEAFNDRDADGLVALAHPRIVFRPTALIGRRRVYHGHEGLRRWVEDLDALPLDIQLHVRDIRPQRPDGFLVLSSLCVGGDSVADAAMIAAVQAGKIVEAHGYLSDESTLAKLGLIADLPPTRA